MFLLLKIPLPRAKMLLWTAVHFFGRSLQESMEEGRKKGGRPKVHVGLTGDFGLLCAILLLAVEDLRGKNGPENEAHARRWWGSDGWRELVEALDLDTHPDRLLTRGMQ